MTTGPHHIGAPEDGTTYLLMSHEVGAGMAYDPDEPEGTPAPVYGLRLQVIDPSAPDPEDGSDVPETTISVVMHPSDASALAADILARMLRGEIARAERDAREGGDA